MRCFFNLVGPHGSLPDQEGIEVANMDELRAEVAETVEEVRSSAPSEAQHWKGWRLEVTDSSGAVIFSVDLHGVWGRSL
jgi:hypothetical protein